MNKKMHGISSLFQNHALKNINLIQVTVTSSEALHCRFSQAGFLFPLKGRAQLTINDEATTYLTSSYVHHIASGSFLHLFSLDQEDFEFILLSYTFGNSSFSAERCIEKSFQLKLWEPKKTHQLLKKLLERITSEDHYHTLAIEIEVRKLLHTVFSQSEKTNQELIETVCEYLKEHLSTPLTLATLSSHFHKRPTQLSHLFYKHYGIRPIDYLIQLRLEKATELLKQGDSVQQAAAKVGYEDAFYFSRLYKKYYHIRPSDIKNYNKQVC